MIPIVKVEPTEPSISLTWMLGSRCNYDCMYCPSELHDSTSLYPNLETLQNIWHNFYNKTHNQLLPYKISFTGGEVTANRSFLPLVTWLKDHYQIDKIIVTTNGSASVRYYLKLAKLVDAISFSTHSEFFNEQKFFLKIQTVNQAMTRPQKSVHVNIMNEYWNQDRIQMYQQWLDQRGISNSVNSINYDRQTRSVPHFQGVMNLVA